ncbi:MAG: glutamate racemase [Rhodoferax sp.]
MPEPAHDSVATHRGDLQNAPIGVFDSGVGGLSVLRALLAELPDERFVYVADSGHAPYGERDEAFVAERTRCLTQWLRQQQGIKTLVVACNTATAAAIHEVRTHHPDLPLVGIEPAIKPAAALSATGRVGVMATQRTVQSAKFARLLHSLHTQADYVVQACDGLAGAIERFDAPEIEALVQEYTRAMGPFGTEKGQIDTLVLGCTHYPFAEDVLHRHVGSAVRFLEAGAPVARQTRRLLEQHRLLRRPASEEQAPAADAVRYYSTGVPQALQAAVERWMQGPSSVSPLN